jgi:hypothetical protein
MIGITITKVLIIGQHHTDIATPNQTSTFQHPSLTPPPVLAVPTSTPCWQASVRLAEDRQPDQHPWINSDRACDIRRTRTAGGGSATRAPLSRAGVRGQLPLLYGSRIYNRHWDLT